MTTKQSPTVKEDGLHASDLPGVLGLPDERVKVQSSGWHDWLMQHSKFRFETAKGSFTAFKSAKGYWTAQRRVDGNLRHQYLGESHTLTYETLEETAQILAAPDYWRKHVSNKGRPREADKELIQKSHKLYETVDKQYETEPSRYETESEPEEVRNKSIELQSRLAEVEAQLKKKDSELAEATNKIEVLEKESRDLRYRCSDLERENARLERLGTDYSHASFQALSAKYQKSLDNAKHWEEVAGSYRSQAEAIAKKKEEAETRLEELEERTESTPEPTALDLLNQFLTETKDKKTGQPIMEALGKGSRDYKRLEQFKEWLEGRR